MKFSLSLSLLSLSLSLSLADAQLSSHGSVFQSDRDSFVSCESARSLGQCISRRWRWVLNLTAVVYESDVLLTEL